MTMRRTAISFGATLGFALALVVSCGESEPDIVLCYDVLGEGEVVTCTDVCEARDSTCMSCDGNPVDGVGVDYGSEECGGSPGEPILDCDQPLEGTPEGRGLWCCC